MLAEILVDVQDQVHQGIIIAIVFNAVMMIGKQDGEVEIILTMMTIHSAMDREGLVMVAVEMHTIQVQQQRQLIKHKIIIIIILRKEDNHQLVFNKNVK